VVLVFLKNAADGAFSCQAGRSDIPQLLEIYVKTKLNGLLRKKKKLKSICCVM
jgi:hypothetical protein